MVSIEEYRKFGARNAAKGKRAMAQFNSEMQELHLITQYLEASKILHWRNNTGAARYQNSDGSFRTVKYGDRGMSDLMALIPGKFVAIEVKSQAEYKFLMKHYDRIKSGKIRTDRDKHLFEQISFIENVKESGHDGFFTYSLPDFIEKFNLVESGL